MIIVCPSCDSQFLVNAKAIGDGRTVKCSSCGNTWYQEPVEEEGIAKPQEDEAQAPVEESQTQTPAPAEEQEPDSEETKEEPADDSPEPADDDSEATEEDTPESEDTDTDDQTEDQEEGDETDTDEDDTEDSEKEASEDSDESEFIDPADDAMTEDDLDEVLGRLQGGADKAESAPSDEQKMDPIPKGLGPNDDDLDVAPTAKPKKKAAGLSFLGSFVIFLALLTGTVLAGITYRDSVAHLWPPAAGFFDKIGLPVHVVGQGLNFSEVTSLVQESDGETFLIVRGRIDNVSEEDITIPPMKIELYNDYGYVQDWITPAEDFVIGAGESVPFEYGLPGLQDKNAASVTLRFTEETQNISAGSSR